jgi:hypothetical protein
MQSRIESEGQDLSREIENAVSLITVPDEVSRVSGDVISELDGRADCLLSLVPVAHASNRSQDLGTLESAYTMETERQIHESLSRADSFSHNIDGEAAESGRKEHAFFMSPDDEASPEPCNDTAAPHACPGAQRRKEDVSEEMADFGENVELF